MIDILGWFGSIGSWISENVVGSALKWLDTKGFLVSALTSKIISLIIWGILAWVLISIFSKAKKPLGWVLIFAIIFVVLSIVTSLFT